MKSILLRVIVIVLCIAAVVIVKVLDLPGFVIALVLVAVGALLIYTLASGASKKTDKSAENPSS